MGEQSEQRAGGAHGGGCVPAAEGMTAPAPVRTSQMEFEAMTRRAGQGYGGYAPHAPLLAVRPKQLSVRREDVLCRRAFHSTDSHAALEALDGAIHISPRHFKAIFNRAATRLQADSAHSHDPKLRRDLDLKRRTKRHHNNTPICFAHLSGCSTNHLGLGLGLG